MQLRKLLTTPQLSFAHMREEKFMHDFWKKDIFTIPNILSFFRLVLIPVYIRLYLGAVTGKDHLLAAAILAVSCLSDAADGMIARKYNMTSRLGQILDPLADKLTQLALTVCLVFRYPALIPVLVLMVVKESFQLIAAISNYRQGKILPGAMLAGKICTTVLFISLICLVMLPHPEAWLINSIGIINILFLSDSFITYIFAYYGKNRKVEDIRGE